MNFINNLETPKFDFNDIALVPSILSKIESRSEIKLPPSLPLIASPMNSVLSIKKKGRFNENFFYQLLGEMMVCIPRGYEYTKDNFHLKWGNLSFKSISLQDFRLIETDFESFNSIVKESDNVLVDIANGHMRKLLDLSKLFIEKFPNKKLMIGNIANPYTYHEFARIGVHYCRLGIGGGSVCFVHDTKVITKDGVKDIIDINIDDMVLSHTGEYKKVIAKHSYFEDESLININSTISTKEHKYYVLNKKDVDKVNDDNIHDFALWISANELTNEYVLLENVQQLE
jgi:hypothetical protein